ncbi:MAG: AEC family transporter [Clostridia bacterium]|nr:AEC family transporter [Clostridia bacterium]
MNLTSFYITVLSLFFIMAVGFVARKAKIINDSASKGLSAVVIKIGQPFMIIGAMLNVEYSSENLKYGLFVLLAGLLLHTVFAVIAHFAVFKYKNADEKKISEFAIIFSNCGFIGFPLIQSFLGDKGLFFATFYIISFNIFIWTWGMVVLGKGRDDIKINPRSMILNYGTLPSIIGIILYLCRASELFAKIDILSFIPTASSYLGSLCTPISMLITGALLATVTSKELFLNPRSYYNCAVKLVLIPIIVTFLAWACGLNYFFIVFFVIVSAMPTASSTVMYGELYEISKKNAAIITGLSSLISMLTLPILATVLNSLFTVSGTLSIFR